MQPATEPLYVCLYCQRAGFTKRGLRVHWCRVAPRTQTAAGRSRECRILTADEMARCQPVGAGGETNRRLEGDTTRQTGRLEADTTNFATTNTTPKT